MLRLALILGHQLQQMPHKPPITLGLSAGAHNIVAWRCWLSTEKQYTLSDPLPCITHARTGTCPNRSLSARDQPY